MQAKILLFLCLGGLGCTEDHTDDKADAGRDQPAEVLVKQRQALAGKTYQRVSRCRLSCKLPGSVFMKSKIAAAQVKTMVET